MLSSDIFIPSNLVWQSADRCESSMCVEVARDEATDTVFIRDSKLGEHSAVLVFSAEEWSTFTAGVRAGDFD